MNKAYVVVNIGGYIFYIAEFMGLYQVVPINKADDVEYEDSNFGKYFLKAKELLDDDLKTSLLVADLAFDRDYRWEDSEVATTENIMIALRNELLNYDCQLAIYERCEWVYILEAMGEDAIYKIGKSKDYPTKRIAEYSPKLPFDTKIIATIPTNNGYAFESALHQAFSAERIRGEWFSLDKEDVDELKKYSLKKSEIIYE